MANEFVQFRINPDTKQKANDICIQCDISLQDYLRMCVSLLIQENQIPFKIIQHQGDENIAISAMKKASLYAKESGIADMSVKEIRDIINKI